MQRVSIEFMDGQTSEALSEDPQVTDGLVACLHLKSKEAVYFPINNIRRFTVNRVEEVDGSATETDA